MITSFLLQKLAYARQSISAMMLHNAFAGPDDVKYGEKDLETIRDDMKGFLQNGFFEGLDPTKTLPLLGFNFSLHDDTFVMYPRDILYLLPDDYKVCYHGNTIQRGNIGNVISIASEEPVGEAFSFANSGLGPTFFGFHVVEQR